MTSTLPVPPMVRPAETPPATPAPDRHRSGVSAFFRGRADEASWVRPSLLALLLLTGVLYIWGLGASGWGNACR